MRSASAGETVVRNFCGLLNRVLEAAWSRFRDDRPWARILFLEGSSQLLPCSCSRRRPYMMVPDTASPSVEPRFRTKLHRRQRGP